MRVSGHEAGWDVDVQGPLLSLLEPHVHSSVEMYTKGGKCILAIGPPLHAHPLLVLPALGWDQPTCLGVRATSV